MCDMGQADRTLRQNGTPGGWGRIERWQEARRTALSELGYASIWDFPAHRQEELNRRVRELLAK